MKNSKETGELRTMRVWPGQPYPQGATWDGAGVNFALFSENATSVELCLLQQKDQDVFALPHLEHAVDFWKRAAGQTADPGEELSVMSAATICGINLTT